ncbi:MAG: hypothetical protein H7Z72_24370 [Bacteroidetes bacterium]|nr:hypothetical protein [Fibrella sp.]
MKTLTRNAFYALVATLLFSACSRPYATFQKTTPERFYTQKATITPAVEMPLVADVPTPVQSIPTAEETRVALSVQTQLNEVLAANKTGLATHKVAKRMNRVRNLLTITGEKQALSPATATAKMGLMAKMVTKKINKQIERKLAPERAKTQSAIRLGIILGIIGLVLIIIGNGFFAGLGGVALVIGLVGILLGYLDVL